MSIPLDRVGHIVREVAADQDPPVEVVAITSGDGGTDRVEVLITIAGCHQEPCRLLLNLDRKDADGFAGAVRERFRIALLAHHT